MLADGAAPLVSIITRTRDRLHLLPRALESVEAQRYPRRELVVVNDGGPRAEVEALVRARAAGAKVLHHEQPRGMEAASNTGLGAATGTHVIFLDDDDTWAPDCLSTLVEARLAAGEGARGVICHSEEVLERVDGTRLEELSRSTWNPELRAVSLERLALRNLFTNNAFLVDRAVAVELGGFEASLPVYGDWDFNLRFFCRHDAVVVPRPLARYHRRPAAPGALGNSFEQRPSVAEEARATLLRLWLTGAGGRSPAVGQLVALLPALEAHRAAALRIDKLFDALHRVRRLAPWAAVERAFLGVRER